MKFWAIRPKSMPDHIRIEKAGTAREACELAFGRTVPDNSPLAKFDIDKWEAKDLGTRVSVIQSDSKRMKLLNDPNNWVDPYEYRK